MVSAACSTLAGCSKANKARAGSALLADAGPDSGSDGVATGGRSARQDSGAGSVSTGTGDCTAVAWDNTGNVENPMVVAVPADAGTKGHMFGRSMGIADYNYLEEEFFFTGTSPAYTTRMVVHRPKDSAKYNGTVIVEWYNVSGQLDFAPEWAWNRNYFMRQGYVHIAVSAQAVGANALKSFDADRYGAINHPGDGASNAIFSQAGVAIRTQSELVLGKCMPVHALIGAGQSQSSFKLAGYVNTSQPTDMVYDGIVLHSGLEAASNNPAVPVFEIFTMNEGNRSLTDGPNLVKWVVAGATHSDVTLSTVGEEAGQDFGAATQPAMCVNPPNDFPSYRVYSAAFDWMNRWVRKGERPPTGTPLETNKDDDGNALGGVRLPEIDVPTATYGVTNSAAPGTNFISGMACSLGGSTTPFSADKLIELYPTHDEYVAKYTQAADKTLAAGFLLKADYDDGIKAAKSAPIPQ
jgi:hypothetical protein